MKSHVAAYPIHLTAATWNGLRNTRTSIGDIGWRCWTDSSSQPIPTSGLSWPPCVPSLPIADHSSITFPPRERASQRTVLPSDFATGASTFADTAAGTQYEARILGSTLPQDASRDEDREPHPVSNSAGSGRSLRRRESCLHLLNPARNDDKIGGTQFEGLVLDQHEVLSVGGDVIESDIGLQIVRQLEELLGWV